MIKTDSFEIRFWGVCGSHPVPGSTKRCHGGNTSCVEVSVNDHTIILDAGTGIIPLGKELVKRANQESKPVEALLLLSHYHHDHTQGFPFFNPAYITGSKLWVMGPELDSMSPQAVLEDIMRSPYFPVRLEHLNAALHIQTLNEKDQILLGEKVGGLRIQHAGDPEPLTTPDVTRITFLQSTRHPGDVLVYRISWQGASVVYASDMENYPEGDQRLISFARGADVLIHDAQYTDAHYLGQEPGQPNTQGYGHSSASMACKVAYSAQVKKLALFHHAPEYDDEGLDQIASEAKALFPETVMAYEGLTIRVVKQVD